MFSLGLPGNLHLLLSDSNVPNLVLDPIYNNPGELKVRGNVIENWGERAKDIREFILPSPRCTLTPRSTLPSLLLFLRIVYWKPVT